MGFFGNDDENTVIEAEEPDDNEEEPENVRVLYNKGVTFTYTEHEGIAGWDTHEGLVERTYTFDDITSISRSDNPRYKLYVYDEDNWRTKSGNWKPKSRRIATLERGQLLFFDTTKREERTATGTVTTGKNVPVDELEAFVNEHDVVEIKHEDHNVEDYENDAVAE